ncbi:MAG: hypothetical protein JWN79_3298 [Gemmatimonadetes bacterium]|jgi:hypothetical protein|nr:hypothetical protein [Gemmatimonadota bacterium]
MPRARTSSLLVLALTLAAAPLVAQTTATPDTTRRPATAPSPAPTALSVSGLIFGSYNFTPSTTPNQLNNQADNGFILDRAYLNFRAPVGNQMSVRVTTDVYQSTENTVNAYTIRAKYAYLQYDGTKSASGVQYLGRLGILQNVLIEHVESFWPRYLSQTAVERAGYFSSADAGIAAGSTLPNRLGEVYATIVNGSSYTSRERDRFKDYALRVSLTPLASHADAGLLQTFTISPWIYKGALASQFVNGGTGQVGAVGEALDRTRYGLFAGIRDPRLVLAAEWAHRRDGVDVGANTLASPRSAGSVSGRLLSAFTILRPFAFTNGTGRSPFAIVARYDHVNPTASSENITTPISTDNAYHVIISGVSYDVNPRVTFAADYQESLASNNGLSNTPPTQSKGYFAHFSIGF